MRICLSSLIVLLPIIGATPGGNRTDIDQQVSHEVTKSSGDTTTKASSWTTFFAPPYLFDDIQKAHLPSAFRVAGTIQALVAPKPSPPDFWEMAKKSEELLQVYVPHLLQSAATYFKSTKITEITSAMHHIVSTTATFRDNIIGSLDAHNITLDIFSQEVEGIFVAIMNDLETIPPPDKAPGHAEREEMVDKILDDTTLELIKLATRYGIEKEVATYLSALKPLVQALVVAIGDINEQHPQLLPVLAFSVAALLIPESWILRPFLSLFGFGPSGPVRGSTAAWLQSRLWGAAVDKGSWFSWLQAAGMSAIPKWVGPVIKVPLLIGGSLLAGLFPCCNRG